MELKTLEIRNFGVHRKADIDLAHQELVFIEGVNLDYDGGSNAAGKTSLLPDAITWCLFGETTKGEKNDDVIRRGEEHRGTRVTLRFLTTAGQAVAVSRYRKHVKYKNGLRLLVDGKDQTRSQVKLTQEALAALVGASRETWLYTTILGQGQSYRFSSLRDAERGALLEEIQGLQLFDAARDHSRSRAREDEQSIDRLTARLETLEERHRRDEEELGRAEKAFAQAAAEETSHREALATEAEVLRSELELRITKRQRFRRREESAVQTVQKREVVETKALERRASVQAALRMHEKAHMQAEALRTKLDDLETCPTCEQPITAAIRAVVSEKYLADARKAHKKATSLADEVSAAAGLVDAQCALTRRVRQSLDEVRESLRKVDRAISKRRGRIDELEKQLARKSPQDAAGPIIARLRASLAEAAEESSKLSKERQRVLEAARYPRWWVDGFQRFRASRMAETVRFLNDRIQVYCDTLFGGDITAYLSIEEKRTGAGLGTKVDLEVTTVGGTYRGASGGEKDRIDLAVAFALHDLAQGSSDFSCNVLVADEIGQAIDPPGIARLAELLHLKLGRVSSVFVVSQNPVWRTHIDKVWTVTRENGASTLTTRK